MAAALPETVAEAGESACTPSSVSISAALELPKRNPTRLPHHFYVRSEGKRPAPPL